MSELQVQLSGDDGTSTGDIKQAQVQSRNGDIGLKVFSDVMGERTTSNRFFLNEVNGNNMAVDVSFGGFPTIITVFNISIFFL